MWLADRTYIADCLRDEARVQRERAAHATEELGGPDAKAVISAVLGIAAEDGPQVAAAALSRAMTGSLLAACAEDLAQALDRIADAITEAGP